jgi:serine protease AprX
MSVRRRFAPALVLPTLLVVPVTFAAAGSVGAADAAPVTAVVSYRGALPDLPGVTVEQSLPSVRAAVVSATPTGLAALGASAAVRSVVPDYPLTFTSGSAAAGPAVFASARLGGGAGLAGAGQGVRVAVVDTGVSDTPALNRASGRLVDAVDTRRDATPDAPLTDGFGHGTFMATVVAGGPAPGSRGRSLGVAPDATVLVVRVAEADGSTSLSQVLGGLDWVAAHADEVDVVSLSLGADRPGPAYVRDPLTDAVQAVQDAGVTAVVSAGNVRGELSDPGFLPTAITVGAADLRAAEVAEDSGSGVVAGVRKPDVVASGVSVIGSLPERSVVARTYPGARVALSLWRGSGTSQAAAVTSGVAAVFLARHPQATLHDVKASLQASAVDLDGRRDGSGLVVVPRELTRATVSPPPEGGEPAEGSDPSWDANSWDANSWDANSWDANSWDANSWDANSWDANSWDANSWDASEWGDQPVTPGAEAAVVAADAGTADASTSADGADGAATQGDVEDRDTVQTNGDAP